MASQTPREEIAAIVARERHAVAVMVGDVPRDFYLRLLDAIDAMVAPTAEGFPGYTTQRTSNAHFRKALSILRGEQAAEREGRE